jgi:catechol 2,3-dioxygenase-like lactoylglutathione lyase family enzyme
MFTHAFLGSNDIEKSRKFYDATMKELGYENAVPPEAGMLVYAGPAGTLVVGKPYDGQPANPSNGATLGLAAQDDETVSRWHQAGLAAGGTDDGAPGPRERAPNNSVGAYLRDPDGNKVCAFHMRH